ncbi:MAG: translation initiation factor IF-2 [Nanoarchaeota archaeon]
MIRDLICTFVGHVNHGKTSIQDFIRGTSIVKQESGAITQKISCSAINVEAIKKICKDLIKKEIKIPGLLLLDTPGHASFTNLRKRGGNLADIAVLVIDINEGLKPQTLEAIEILKNYKTPFVIAANKIDLINGFRSNHEYVVENINSLNESYRQGIDNKLYTIVARLAEMNLLSDRFDRIDDYTKQIAIIPTSAKLGLGIPELLLVLIGLAQKYLEKNLEIDINKPAKGTILEVMEEKGIGKILDTVIYDGHLRKEDTLVIGGLEEPVVAKIKSLLVKNIKTSSVEEINAAANVRISLADTEKEIFAGMPFVVANKNIEKIKQEIQKEVDEVLIQIDKEGVIVKADSLGSLEALISLLKEHNIKIRKASIGDISKKDIAEAASDKYPINRVILAFNVRQLEKTNEVKIFNHDIIYKIVDDYEDWHKKEKSKEQSEELKNLARPCKIYLMPNYIFRQSNPAVLGVEIIAGTLKPGMKLMKEGKEITEVKGIQEQGKNIPEAAKGKEVAVSFIKVIVGRQINSGDVLYSSINEEEFRKLKKLKKHLSDDEIKVMKEIAEIKRKENPVWGI